VALGLLASRRCCWPGHGCEPGARRPGWRRPARSATRRNLAVFLTLYLTFWYASALEVTSDAALVFYGGWMLLAALRGYAGARCWR
jgi:hypothetical protein